MAKVEGLKQLQRNLKEVLANYTQGANGSADSGDTVVVGFTQKYAIYVHENLTARHPVGQAKFLEQPARELGEELGKMIGELVKRGKTMTQGLLLAGLRLQREAQKLCPVDTGALKNSAFTRVDSGK